MYDKLVILHCDRLLLLLFIHVRLPGVSPGHEGVFPDSRCPLHPVPDISGCQSLFRTEEHALLRWLTGTLISSRCLFSTSPALKLLLCSVFCITRSSTKVFDSADVCGPHYQVRFKENANSLPLVIDFNLYFMILYSHFSSPAWWFSIWGLVPKPSKTILMLSCLRITKIISFLMTFNSIRDFISTFGLYDALVKCMNMCSLTFDLPAEFLSFYGLLNFYLYTLAFVYSPSKNALYGRWYNTL